MNDLVMRDGDEVFTTSEVIAEQADVEHRATLQLLKTHMSDFEEFGQVAFEMRAGYNNSQVRVARLNEPQATLMLTYLKNSPRVIEFKKALVKAFFEMAKQLRTPVEMSHEELMASALISAHAVLAERDKALAVAAPKAEAYDAFMDADGTYAVQDVAKALGVGRDWLFAELRKAGILIATGSARNTPYAKYMGHFAVRVGSVDHKDGSRTSTRTTRVKPSGVDFICRKLNLTGPAAALALTQ